MPVAIKLFMRLVGQSTSIHQAKEQETDNFVCFFSEFPTPKQVRRVKEIVRATVKCMDANSDIEFWEE